jgi:hypothetical protein
MDIEDLQKIAEGKLSEFPQANAETVLKWIKSNLKDLWFLNDFEGMQQPVAEDVTRALINVVCLGRILKVDIKKTIECEFGLQEQPAHTADAEKKAPAGEATQQPQGKTSETKAPTAEETAETAKEAGPQKTDTAAPPQQAPEKTTDKQAIMAMYERELRACKAKADADKIWRQDITVDKRLEGKDKVQLQKVYNEVRKGLTT